MPYYLALTIIYFCDTRIVYLLIENVGKPQSELSSIIEYPKSKMLKHLFIILKISLQGKYLIRFYKSYPNTSHK